MFIWRWIWVWGVIAPALLAIPALAQLPGRGAPVNTTSQVPAQTASPSIITRRMQFTIPFTVDAAARNQTREVQLYVSTDRGANWVLYARQGPNSQNFSFRAAADGEYWFASHTLRGSDPPPAQHSPELMVAIDTTQPNVQLESATGPSGEITARWQVSDLNLARETLKLEYQVGAGQPWKSVAIDGAVRQILPTNLMGEASWLPQQTARLMNVRLEVSDRAGNVGSATRRLFVDQDVARRAQARQAPTQPAPAQVGPSQGVPAQGGPAQGAQALQTLSPSGGARGPVDPFARYFANTDTYRPPVAAANSPLTGAASPSTSIAATPPAVGARPDLFRQGATPGQSWNPVNGNRTSDQLAPENLAQASGASGFDQGAGSGQRRLPSTAYREVTGQVRQSAEEGGAESPEAGSSDGARLSARDVVLPPGQTPRLTKSTQFNLAYDIEAVGASGVARVELWITRNGGRTWSLYGRDADKTSPFRVEVEGEGIYGFRMIIVNGSGLAGRTPEAGDLADLWIAVDTTPPTARITSAVYGTGPRAGILDIRWEAEDQYLSERPVTLSFSKSPEGPWTPLASGIPHTGQYDWRVDASLPKQVYLRLQVYDQAGLVATHTLDEPVSLEGLSPKARIRSFTPIDEARRAWWQLR